MGQHRCPEVAATSFGFRRPILVTWDVSETQLTLERVMSMPFAQQQPLNSVRPHAQEKQRCRVAAMVRFWAVQVRKRSWHVYYASV